MIRLLFLSIALLYTVSNFAQTINISESSGWLESAYVKWDSVENAESYNVYYSGEGITNKKIDNQLIRKYNSYFRADILGLKAGNYTLKVVPVIDGMETSNSATADVTVEAHDRTGFAFANSKVPGAYKADGTPKDNAIILYITQNTKDNISLDVTGANANPCVGLLTILEGFKKGDDNRPLIIRLIGQITDLEYMNKGDIVIENDNNASSYITIEGVGDDAVADGWGIRIKNASNVEVRNIATMNCNSDEGDNIGLQQDNEYIWIHHCDFFYGDAGGDSDQAKGDGALDCKRSTYVTFSYNHFWDSGKCNLLGLSEDTTEGLFITYHHNWYDHSDSRHPRVRFYSAHVYNNYYDGNSKYGVGSTLGSSVFVENNYFRNCKYPILTSMQGSDVYDSSTGSNDYSDMPTFSKEDGGCIKAFNNYMTGQKRFVAYGESGFPNSTVDYDAYVANTRDDTIANTVVSSFGSNTYNNFDTDSETMYSYTAESPEQAKATVMEYSGRMLGGDFQWTFNNSIDDASYAVNASLKAALISYTTGLIAVQGDSAVVIDTTGGGTGGGDIIEGDMVHNFTQSGTTSTFYNISGNISDSKGTIEYGGLTLTHCLKIESSTSVSFTTTEESTFTMVFNDDYTGRIKINGTNYTASAGKVIKTIPAGSYEITKADVANLFFMSCVYPTTIGVSMAEKAKPCLYPNPAAKTFNIEYDGAINNISIYSMTGQLIKQEHSNKSIDISEITKGSYLVRINTSKGLFTQILIKN